MISDPADSGNCLISSCNSFGSACSAHFSSISVKVIYVIFNSFSCSVKSFNFSKTISPSMVSPLICSQIRYHQFSPVVIGYPFCGYRNTPSGIVNNIVGVVFFVPVRLIETAAAGNIVDDIIPFFKIIG
jgi:hypothetical protein